LSTLVTPSMAATTFSLKPGSPLAIIKIHP
jgi:hypothetical protein